MVSKICNRRNCPTVQVAFSQTVLWTFWTMLPRWRLRRRVKPGLEAAWTVAPMDFRLFRQILLVLSAPVESRKARIRLFVARASG